MTILVLGATSSIARAISMKLAQKKESLYLAGRDMIELEKIAQDIHLRYGTKVFFGEFDSEDISSHAVFFKTVLDTVSSLDGVIFAVGTLDLPAQKILAVNLNGAVSILEIGAAYFETRLSGFILALSSVAGDRGRQSNYIYGAAKAGLNIYLEGLQNRLFKKNIKIINIKLGFVDTAMTFGLPKIFLAASPEIIADKIIKILQKKSIFNNNIYYLPRFWGVIMFVIRQIPSCIFKRLSL